ncbi:BUL1 [Candida margitis]|uniref:BUL1 n=1 Tax=Candida margitis TaxID=1775924 RepID=UPI0022271561|nr:BUL1 [Candida margitis]KAI5970855.1 BUL1 [Candida margitis]
MAPKPKYSKTQSFDETISTILPSYSMYTSTIGMNINVPEDNDDDLPPPHYQCNNSEWSASSESTNVHEIGSSAASTTPTSLEEAQSRRVDSDSSTTTVDNIPLIVADENANLMETILDNVHRLPNMTFEKQEISKAVELKVFYTKDIGEVGKSPELIDPSIYEYKQGNLLNGYIIIKNTSNRPIPFDMFYLLFEGNFMVANERMPNELEPVKIRRFLEMFDFYGSWNEAHINRLVTETASPYLCEYGNTVDPLDGTYLYFGPKKEILPNRVYKRFFSFKIPNNLLDSECNEHNLSRHVELPPTIGLSRWEVAHYPERNLNKIKDFSIMNTSMGFGVMARFIGRKSTWEVDFGKIVTPKHKDNAKLVNSKGDEYIILKELTNYIRVIPTTNIPTENERLMKLVENRLLYDNLVKRVKDKIDIGNQLEKALQSKTIPDLSPDLTQEEIEAAKMSQSYQHADSIRDIKSSMRKLEYYEVHIQLVKRSITGHKNSGVLQVKTPKQEYRVKYIPPCRFREDSIKELEKTWKFDVPIDLTTIFPSNDKMNAPPTIKTIDAELVVHTMRSMNAPIALEFNHDLVYNKYPNNSKRDVDLDTFSNNVVRPFRNYSTELYHLTQRLGLQNFRIEKQLVDDLKSICKIEEKSNNLVIGDVLVDNEKFNYKKNGIKWTMANNAATSSINLNVNLGDLSLKGVPISTAMGPSYDRFNLVPDFQSCFMTRSYHLKLTFELSNGECARIKVPVIIEKA